MWFKRHKARCLLPLPGVWLWKSICFIKAEIFWLQIYLVKIMEAWKKFWFGLSFNADIFKLKWYVCTVRAQLCTVHNIQVVQNWNKRATCAQWVKVRCVCVCVCRMLVSSKNCRDPDFSPFSSLRDEWRSPVKSLAPGSCINYRSARWTFIQLDTIQLYTLFQCLHRQAAPGLTYSQTSTCKQTPMYTTDTTFLRIAWIKAKSVTKSFTLYYS